LAQRSAQFSYPAERDLSRRTRPPQNFGRRLPFRRLPAYNGVSLRTRRPQTIPRQTRIIRGRGGRMGEEGTVCIRRGLPIILAKNAPGKPLKRG
jgi:hypothetical protein